MFRALKIYTQQKENDVVTEDVSLEFLGGIFQSFEKRKASYLETLDKELKDAKERIVEIEKQTEKHISDFNSNIGRLVNYLRGKKLDHSTFDKLEWEEDDFIAVRYDVLIDGIEMLPVLLVFVDHVIRGTGTSEDFEDVTNNYAFTTNGDGYITDVRNYGNDQVYCGLVSSAGYKPAFPSALISLRNKIVSDIKSLDSLKDIIDKKYHEYKEIILRADEKDKSEIARIPRRFEHNARLIESVLHERTTYLNTAIHIAFYIAKHCYK